MVGSPEPTGRLGVPRHPICFTQSASVPRVGIGFCPAGRCVAMCGQPVSAFELFDKPRAAAEGVAWTVIPAENAATVTSTRTRRSIANIRSRYAGHPKISTVRSWLLDGGPPMNDGFGTRTASSVPVEPMTAFGATWPFHHDVDDCRVVAVCGPPSSRISRPMSWQGQMDAEVPRDI